MIKKLRVIFNKFSALNPAKALVFMVLFLLLVALIFAGKRPYKFELHEGDISLSDIYAPYEFMYPAEIDEAGTAALREKALKDFLPVYDIRMNYWDEKRRILSNFFRELANVKKLQDVDDNWRIEKLKKAIDLELENRFLFSLLPAETGLIEEKGSIVLNKLSSKIIADDVTIKKLFESGKEEIVVRDKRLNVEAKIPFADLYTKEKLEPIIEKALVEEEIKDVELRKGLINLLSNIVEPNLLYNQAETEARRKTLLEGLSPVYNQALVKKNELIIGKGERATKTHLLELDQFTKKETVRAKIAYLGGIIVLFVIFVMIIPIYLKSYQPKEFGEIKNLYLVSIVVLLTVILAKVITASPLPSYFIPISAATMLVAILLNADVAFMLSIILSIFTGIIAGGKFDVLMVLLIGGVAAVYFIRGARRRSQILKAGFLVGLLEFAVICGMGLLNALEPKIFLAEGCWGIASGIVSSGIVMFLLPFFEFLFKITTDITLLELSDLNRPLLKRMVLNAPGTYHHSLVVGNLAEAASDAIGANSLLARVGAYYHDIGKIEKAEYFSENEASHRSPHEKLTPSMSALIIQSHVKDGIELAKKDNLSKTIIDFIAQHHGTSLIYYFYQRALEKIKDEDELKEEGFRYTGPKPQTKEAAIVLLADAVEASSRTLNDPTPSRIKGLVQKIINNKFIDNQLDMCDLTLRDLNKIASAFVRILTGIFHTRVEYPEENKTKNKNKKTF